MLPVMGQMGWGGSREEGEGMRGMSGRTAGIEPTKRCFTQWRSWKSAHVAVNVKLATMHAATISGEHNVDEAEAENCMTWRKVLVNR